MTTLACQQLDISIGGKTICQDLQIELQPGQFWGLLGPNGIGKTTLLKCLAGLTMPERGYVLLAQQGIEKMHAAPLRVCLACCNSTHSTFLTPRSWKPH